MTKFIKTLAMAALLTVATAASASHIFTTNPSINNVALDSVNGFTNPTINATVGDSLNLVEGFYDHCGGTCGESWTLHFAQTSGDLALSDFSQFINGSGDPSNPLYLTFTETLAQAGSFTGFLQPIQGGSCPSYRYGNGVEGGDGCGNPSESLPFTLNVAAATGTVPEPASIALFGLGLLGFAASRRKSAK